MRRADLNSSQTGEKIVILGGGITGLTVAWELSKNSELPVLLIEQNVSTGGLAGSFHRRDRIFDFGSHRIHEQYDPEVLGIIRELLGDELLKRPRRGQIRIQGKFLNYPPSITQILTSFGLAQTIRLVRDFLLSRNNFFFIPHRATRPTPLTSFEEYATRAVGKSLYKSFYRPYALKLWGMSPAELSFEPAVSRVRKFELPAVWKELKNKAAGYTTSNSFYYPARGFGQIAEKILERFIDNGGEILFESSVQRLELKNDCEIEAIQVETRGVKSRRFSAKLLISTVPIDVLHQLVCSALGGETVELGLSWRSLRILYLFTPDKIPSVHETYYFPEPDVIFGRVSEPAKYSPFLNQAGEKTALVIEIPCTFGDEIWNLEDEVVAERCISDLRKLKILSPWSTGDAEYFSRRIKNLYPVYKLGWREKLDEALRRFNSIKNLYCVGRPALFLHCNVDHCMAMGLKLARFLSAGSRTKEDWECSLGDVFSLSLHD
ncbi:MAG TPA: FAD-dependent oxidoreductase [Pyrinomonadaceae bacterium]